MHNESIARCKHHMQDKLVYCCTCLENDFEMAKILIDDGKVDVNIKYDCRDTTLIAVCQQTPLQSEEEAVKLLIIYGRAVLNSTPQINQGRQP